MQEWRPRDVLAGIWLRQSRTVWQDGYKWRMLSTQVEAQAQIVQALLRRFLHYGSPLGRTATSALQSALTRQCLARQRRQRPHQAEVERQAGAAAGIRADKRSSVGIVGWQQGAAALPDPPGNARIVGRQDWHGLPARLGGRQRHCRGRSAGFPGYQCKDCVH